MCYILFYYIILHLNLATGCPNEYSAMDSSMKVKSYCKYILPCDKMRKKMYSRYANLIFLCRSLSFPLNTFLSVYFVTQMFAVHS